MNKKKHYFQYFLINIRKLWFVVDTNFLHTEMKLIQLDLCRQAPSQSRNIERRKTKTVLQVKFKEMDMNNNSAANYRLLIVDYDDFHYPNQSTDAIPIAQTFCSFPIVIHKIFHQISPYFIDSLYFSILLKILQLTRFISTE